MSNIVNLQASTQPVASATQGGAFKVTNHQAGEARMDLNKQWAARPYDQKFLSLSELAAHAQKQQDESHDQILLPGEIEVLTPELKTRDDANKLSFAIGSKEYAANHWAFGQVCQRAGAPASYLRKLASPIVADNLNYGLKFLGNKEGVKAYLRENGENELHALTGPDYGRVFNASVINAVRNVAGNGTGDTRWKVPGVMDWSTMIYNPDAPITKATTTLFSSDRDCFMFLVDDKHPIEVGKIVNKKTGALEPDLMFRGFYVYNSEVGAGSLKLAAFYLRAICCNRIMWGVENFQEVTIRHTKFAPDRFIHEAEPALIGFANGSSDNLIEGVTRAKEAQLAKDDDEMIDFLVNRSLSKAQAKKVIQLVEEEEGTKTRTAWDAAQGITALARSIPNNSDRVEVESVARKILDKVA